MANSAQARKRARQNVKRRQLKASQRSMVRTFIKHVVKAVEDKNYEAATEAYKKAVPVIARIADKGVIHKNKAARHKSRLKNVYALAFISIAPYFKCYSISEPFKAKKKKKK